jgi:hypothetical protein
VLGDGAEAKAFACLQAGDVDAPGAVFSLETSFICPSLWLAALVGMVPFLYLPVCSILHILSPWSWQKLCRLIVLIVDGLLVMWISVALSSSWQMDALLYVVRICS